MKLIFTKSKSILSIFIRWGLKEPVSHFVIVFDNSIAFHSNLLGTHISWFPEFKKSCDIPFSIERKLSLKVEEEIYQSVIDKNIGKKYDFKAFAYFMWRAFLYRVFKKPFPEKNAWGKSNQFLCTGLAAKLPKKYFPKLEKIQDTEMTSPYQLYLKLK